MTTCGVIDGGGLGDSEGCKEMVVVVVVLRLRHRDGEGLGVTNA